MSVRERYDVPPSTITLGEFRQYGNVNRTGSYTATPHTVVDQGITSALVVSEGHRGPPYRSGGPFLMSRWGSTITKSASATINNLSQQYVGGFAIRGSFAGTFPADNTSKLVANGTSAWGRFAPTKEGVGLGQFLGELHDLPRVNTMINEAYHYARNMRNAGSAYLNIQFGWVPFIRDIRDALRTMDKIEQRLAQLTRDNGKTVRRSGIVTRSSSIVSSKAVGSGQVTVQPALVTQFYSRTGEWFRDDRTQTLSKYWFSGKYRYYIPDIKTRHGRARTLLRQFGLDVTPQVFWNLMPWTWLADWYGSYGDIARNITAMHQYNLTAKYAYIMGHELSVTEQSQQIWDRNGTPHIMSRKSITELKSRMAATPYGFGVKADSLNDYQISILAALGVSRRW